MTIATADLFDERGDELDSLGIQLQDIGGRTAFDGPIRTVRCHRDNALVKATLATPGEGAVLVVDGGGSLESALVGDLIAASAVAAGWSGVIVYGAIRDREAIGGLDLGVKAGVVDKSGSWFSYGDQRIGQGRENAKTFLKENASVANEIEDKIRAAHGLEFGMTEETGNGGGDDDDLVDM